MYRFFN